jgi:hypothetical protein
MVKARRSGCGSTKKQKKHPKKTSTRRGGLIVGGEKVMSSITDEIEDNSEAGFNKIKKGVDELTTVITKTVVSGKKRAKKIPKKDNTSETETFNKELLKDLKEVNKNTEKLSTILESETKKIGNDTLKVDVTDIVNAAMVGDVENLIKIMEKDLKHAYADHFAIRSKLNKILKSFKIADIDADDSFEKMAENDKHMIDLNIKELQETKKVINKIKKTVGGRKMRVSGGGGDEPYASDVMEVMDITVLEVIADNPPASNPEYIELPKSEKSLIVKFAERSRAVLVNSSLVLAYISNSIIF